MPIPGFLIWFGINSFSSRCLAQQHNSSMVKRLKSQEGESNGYDYFENLPDEVVILIFTKLSSASGNNTLEEDIKSLVQCSSVSKRFNALNSLVPTLYISHPSIKLLNKCCPKILNKFKHIGSLHVSHYSTTKTESYDNELDNAPFIFWDAVYEPDNYCLVAVSCTHITKYVPKHSSLQRRRSMHVNVAKHVKDKLCVSNRDDTSEMFAFHHMLVSSIREHKMLESVMVANMRSPELGNLTLEGDMLAKLKTCTSTNLQQVQFRDRSGCADILDVPLTQNRGYVMNNVYFNIIEWWEKAPDQIHKVDDDDDIYDHSIPKALHFKSCIGILLKKVLEGLLENVAYRVLSVDHKITNDLLSYIK